jgi:hypothetical protein
MFLQDAARIYRKFVDECFPSQIAAVPDVPDVPHVPADVPHVPNVPEVPKKFVEIFGCNMYVHYLYNLYLKFPMFLMYPHTTYILFH